jgi:hydroxymethylbilane synthase
MVFFFLDPKNPNPLSNLRIGTRSSELALWQARRVQAALLKRGHSAELVHIQSSGDTNLQDPLHRMGMTGIFTKALDDALYAGAIDLAVHSLKDVPTRLPEGLVLAAVLPRGACHDVLVHKGDLSFLQAEKAVIATGSLRRRAQWRHRYPQHQLVGLRGNVNTRLQKLADHPWQGAIFAQAGLARIDQLPDQHQVLEWMVPAPAQGIVGIACRADQPSVAKALHPLNHTPTWQAAQVERSFMRTLEGGCTAPIGAHAIIEDHEVRFRGVLLTPDGQQRLYLEREGELQQRQPQSWGRQWAQEALSRGGKAIMQAIRAELAHP